MNSGALPHITTTNVVENGKKLRESYFSRPTRPGVGHASEITGKFAATAGYDLSPEAFPPLPELLPGMGIAMAW